MVGIAALVGIVSVLGYHFREPLQRFGVWFVGRFGIAGLVVGTAVADGVHFPLPPQFYLLTGVAAGFGAVPTLLAVLTGSEIGSIVAFSIGRMAASTGVVARVVARPRAFLESFLARHGRLGLALAALLPISWCVLCATLGAMRLSRRELAVLLVMRVPKIALSYAVIELAWRP